MLKKIIVIRHGDYDETTMDLNENGKSQIRKIIPIIKENIKEYKNICLLSSNALRAESSIQIISEELNILYEMSDCLWSDHEHTIKIDQAMDLIREKEINNIDLIIILTHIEYTVSIPKRFAWSFDDHSLLKDMVKNGEMVIIDRLSKGIYYYS